MNSALPIRAAQGSRASVLLADDHHLVRAGLCALMAGLPDFEVVAQAGNGIEALQLIESVQPMIAVLDIEMPGLSGLEVLNLARVQFPRTRVILLSMHVDQQFVSEAVRLGAAGYLLKDVALTELVAALRAVVRGDTYLTARVANKLTAAFSALEKASEAPALSPRQLDVLRLVAAGCSSKEIARDLALSVKTIETHRAQIMRRLEIHDVASLVRYAVRKGIAPADE